jgi:hypothetical protein
MNVQAKSVRGDRSGQGWLPALGAERVPCAHSRGDDLPVDVPAVAAARAAGEQLVVQPWRQIDLPDAGLRLGVADVDRHEVSSHRRCRSTWIRKPRDPAQLDSRLRRHWDSPRHGRRQPARIPAPSRTRAVDRHRQRRSFGRNEASCADRHSSPPRQLPFVHTGSATSARRRLCNPKAEQRSHAPARRPSGIVICSQPLGGANASRRLTTARAAVPSYVTRFACPWTPRCAPGNQRRPPGRTAEIRRESLR